MLNLDDVIAIDIHTHAEEPCGTHARRRLRRISGGAWPNISSRRTSIRRPSRKPRPIIATQKIAAVIFPVDAERETGFRRYNNEEVAELAAAEQRHPDSVRQHRSGQGQGWARARRAG